MYLTLFLLSLLVIYLFCYLFLFNLWLIAFAVTYDVRLAELPIFVPELVWFVIFVIVIHRKFFSNLFELVSAAVWHCQIVFCIF